MSELGDIRQMTSDVLGAIRSQTPKLDRLDERLDDMEKAQIARDAAFAAMLARIGEAERELAEHKSRIKSLEDDRIRVKAWATLLALLASVGGFLFGKLWR